MYYARAYQPATINGGQGRGAGTGDFEGEYERRGEENEGEILVRISFMNTQNSLSHDGKRNCKDLLLPA